MTSGDITHLTMPYPMTRTRLSKLHGEVHDAISPLISLTTVNLRPCSVELIVVERRQFPGKQQVPCLCYDPLLHVGLAWKDRRKKRPSIKIEADDPDAVRPPPRKRA